MPESRAWLTIICTITYSSYLLLVISSTSYLRILEYIRINTHLNIIYTRILFYNVGMCIRIQNSLYCSTFINHVLSFFASFIVFSIKISLTDFLSPLSRLTHRTAHMRAYASRGSLFSWKFRVGIAFRRTSRKTFPFLSPEPQRAALISPLRSSASENWTLCVSHFMLATVFVTEKIKRKRASVPLYLRWQSDSLAWQARVVHAPFTYSVLSRISVALFPAILELRPRGEWIRSRNSSGPGRGGQESSSLSLSLPIYFSSPSVFFVSRSSDSCEVRRPRG